MSEPTGPTDPTRPMPAAQPPAEGQTPPPPSTKPPGLWRQATSTTGGTIAAIVASVLTLLLVVGVLGLGAAAAVRAVAGHDDRDDRVGPVRMGRDRDDLPPGQQRRLEKGPKDQRPGNGNGNGNGNGQGQGEGKAKGGQGNGAGSGLGGMGMGPLMGGLGALGDVQHGELTVQDATGKPVVMTVQRGTVTAASDTSVSVRSADGFSATYVVDDSTRGRAGDVAKDDSVLVLAQKAGRKAVAIRAVRSS